MEFPPWYTPDVESALGMELLLNLAWVLLAGLMFGLWLRHTPRTGGNRLMQLVALALLVLILFPAISVTDDLQLSQNPAETNSFQRRDHAAANPHSIFPAVDGLPLPVFGELSFGTLRVAAPDRLSAPVVGHPALAAIQNRPPPAA